MKKDFGSKLTKITVFVASIAAALALVFKLKKDNSLLTTIEDKDEDEYDFGEVEDLDSLNPDTSTRQYVSINITKNDEE